MKSLYTVVDDSVYSFEGKERNCDEKKKGRGIKKKNG